MLPIGLMIRKKQKFLPEEETIRKNPKKVKGDTTVYKILKVEDNITNGMQAMALAPVKMTL